MIWIADFLILSLRLLVRLYIAQHVRKRGAWGPSALCWSSHLAICVHTLACLTQSNSGLFWPALSLLSSSAEESSFSLLPCLMLCSFCLAQLLIPLDFRDHPMKDFQHKFFGWTTLQKVEVDRKKLCESWFVVQFWHPKYWNVPHSSWPLVPDVIFFFFLSAHSLSGRLMLCWGRWTPGGSGAGINQVHAFHHSNPTAHKVLLASKLSIPTTCTSA